MRHFLSYHIFFFLSSPFQNFFQEFFLSFFALVRYLSVYHILSFLSRPFVIFFYCLFFCPLSKTLYSRLRSLLRFLSGFFEVLPSLTALLFYLKSSKKSTPFSIFILKKKLTFLDYFVVLSVFFSQVPLYNIGAVKFSNTKPVFCLFFIH